MMKTITFYFFMSLTVLACQPESSQNPESTAMLINIDSLSSPISPTKDTAVIHERRLLKQQELEYYLSRHNVDDEGFDMVARYADKGDSLLAAYTPHVPATPIGVFHFLTIPRRGLGLIGDTIGRIIIGTWHADTLLSGIRADSMGTYAGRFNKHLQAEGHGAYRTTDGNYYEGHFEQDCREGFGFFVTPHNLQAGIWKKDRFLGEHMHYTSDRIYGIDISRYQHEQGRRRYAIDWRNMRITSLGRNPRRRILGTVDYPVSFVYIKASESTTIRNRYYPSDYIAARRQGLRVGAYHFFSTKQSGVQQACYFLSLAGFREGDLPPVLDVEPSDAQIQKMGGHLRLFQEMRVWIDIVKKRTGMRPILYLNQRFVKKYLDDAPDLKENYQVWIARYSEYKPDVHLALWQLSADGKVNGIHGDVDINVFNGYVGQWEEFLREETYSVTK